jgi:hypothetical protein
MEDRNWSEGFFLSPLPLGERVRVRGLVEAFSPFYKSHHSSFRQLDY